MESSPPAFSALRAAAVLVLLVLLALVVRVTAAVDYGRDWYAPGSFTQINFDEAGSCRAALEGFTYSPFVGYQTLVLARLAGHEDPGAIAGDARAVKAYCHSPEHLTIARLFSAVTGALTVVALYLLALVLFPGQPGVALGAAALFALSGWHIGESLMGTVDAASTFFIYSFLAAAAWAARSGGARWLPAAALLVPALWAKYWIFALLALAALIPEAFYRRVLSGLSGSRMLVLIVAYAALFGLVTNPALSPPLPSLLPLLFYVLVPWRALSTAGLVLLLAAPWLAPLALQSDTFVAYTAGSLSGRFGTDYGAIGWHKPLRNLINLPVVAVIGLGLPGFIAAIAGLRRLLRERPVDRVWLVLLPVAAFALYMLFLAPVTYYRHYLPLLPALCLLAAFGVAGMRGSRQRRVWGLLLLWQAALAWDLVSDYHFDPRRQLPDWYAEARPGRVLASYYVNPPPVAGVRHGLFRVRALQTDPGYWSRADTLILSENWYDTAFANELNGPRVHDPERLIKTAPAAVAFYRQALAGAYPRLQPVVTLRPPTFMPELLLHRATYGSFTQFVGVIAIFRILPVASPKAR